LSIAVLSGLALALSVRDGNVMSLLAMG